MDALDAAVPVDAVRLFDVHTAVEEAEEGAHQRPGHGEQSQEPEIEDDPLDGGLDGGGPAGGAAGDGAVGPAVLARLARGRVVVRAAVHRGGRARAFAGRRRGGRHEPAPGRRLRPPERRSGEGAERSEAAAVLQQQESHRSRTRSAGTSLAGGAAVRARLYYVRACVAGCPQAGRRLCFFEWSGVERLRSSDDERRRESLGGPRGARDARRQDLRARPGSASANQRPRTGISWMLDILENSYASCVSDL